MKNLPKLGTLFYAAITSSGAFGLGGDFTLTADTGSHYSLRGSPGKVVVISFGFTFRPDVCPTALATIATALNAIDEEARMVDALFISLDPGLDTPEHLREITRFFNSGLRGLTGAPEQLGTPADPYRVRHEFVGNGETGRCTYDHSAHLHIVDTNGQSFRMLSHGLPQEYPQDSLRSTSGAARSLERFSERLGATGG